jgi:hypothetical protein
MKPVRKCAPKPPTSVAAPATILPRFDFRSIDRQIRARRLPGARRTSILILAALLLAHGLQSAAAETRDPAAGEALFREGRRLLKAGDLQNACAKLEESQRLDPAPGTLANLADCEEQLGRTASAWEHWRRVAEQLPATDSRRATARARSTLLEKQVARLSIALAPPLAQDPPPSLLVKRDGVALGQAAYGVPLPLDPGRHLVLVTARDHRPQSFEVSVLPGEQRQLVVSAGARAEANASSFPPLTPPPLSAMASSSPSSSSTLDLHAGVNTESHRDNRRIVGYSLLGAGVAAVGGGIFFGTRALRARDDARENCAMAAPGAPPPVCWGRARNALARDTTYSRLADATIAGGTVAAIVGAYLLFTGREDHGAESGQTAANSSANDIQPARWAWSVTPGHDGGGEVSLATRF